MKSWQGGNTRWVASAYHASLTNVFGPSYTDIFGLPYTDILRTQWVEKAQSMQVWTLVLHANKIPRGSNLRESRFSRILENFFPISLLDLDLEAFSFHFSLSISISRHFHFTFHSRNEWKEKKNHFSFLGKSERISDFTLFREKKRVKLCM